MAYTQKNEPRENRLSTIARGTKIKGDIQGGGDLLVEGEIEGDVRIAGDLTVTDTAALQARVEARTVRIEGRLEGDIQASGAVHIAKQAHVRADLRGARITLDEGAHFVGRLDCAFEIPERAGGDRLKRS